MAPALVLAGGSVSMPGISVVARDRAAPAPAWTPASEATLVAWYDASNLGSITSSGGLVSQMNDLSGHAHHWTQATGANQFTTGTQTVNGLNALDSTNTFRKMVSSTFSITECMFFSVFKLRTNGGNVVWIGFNGSGSLIYQNMRLASGGASGNDRDESGYGAIAFPSSASVTTVQSIGGSFQTSTNPDRVFSWRSGTFSSPTNVTESTFSQADETVIGASNGDGINGLFCEAAYFSAHDTVIAGKWWTYVQAKWAAVA